MSSSAIGKYEQADEPQRLPVEGHSFRPGGRGSAWGFRSGRERGPARTVATARGGTPGRAVLVLRVPALYTGLAVEPRFPPGPATLGAQLQVEHTAQTSRVPTLCQSRVFLPAFPESLPFPVSFFCPSLVSRRRVEYPCWVPFRFRRCPCGPEEGWQL